jgi:hypothetical protein
MKAAPWVRAIVGWVFLPFRLNYGPSVSPKNSTAYQDAVTFRRTVNEGYATRAMLQAAPTGIYEEPLVNQEGFVTPSAFSPFSLSSPAASWWPIAHLDRGGGSPS